MYVDGQQLFPESPLLYVLSAFKDNDINRDVNDVVVNKDVNEPMNTSDALTSCLGLKRHLGRRISFSFQEQRYPQLPDVGVGRMERLRQTDCQCRWIVCNER